MSVSGRDLSACEAGVSKRLSFDDASVRAAFVRKVFGIVSVMLGVTAFMSAIPFLHTPLRGFVRERYWIYILSYIVFLVVYISLMCFKEVRRSFPCNIICTAILTLAAGVMTMMITAYHDIESVLIALLVTTLCCTAIILFATQTKYDFTSWIGIMCIASLGLFLFGIIAVVAARVFHVYWLYLLYAFLAAVFFMIFLAIDVQMILGGRRHEIDPEEYIYAAVQVFLDILFIFWMCLTLTGSANRN